MDTPYVWRCSECGDDFEGSGPGHSAFMKHAQEDHGMKPAQCAGGVVDVHTDEVVLPGCGTQVLMKGRKLGFITENPNSRAVDIGSYDDPDDAPKVNAKPAATRKPSKAELGALAIKEQRGYTVMKDIILRRSTELIFSEAQQKWPERYQTGKPSEDISLFIEEMVTVGSIAIGMEFGRLIAEETARRLTESEESENG